MFETAELGRTVSRKRYKKAVPVLRQELLELQERLRIDRPAGVVLLFAGVDGGGKGETVSLLNEWMDARWLQTRAYDEPTAEESERPDFWCYWRDLPPRGRIGMFLSAWYSTPVVDRAYDRIDEAGFQHRLDRIQAFERALADDGTVILKFWMHLSREAQEHRLKSLSDDPLTSARVTEQDWENWRRYDRFVEAAEQVIARTSVGPAPWTIVEGEDHNFRVLEVASTLRDRLQRIMEESLVRERVAAAMAGKSAKEDTAKPAKAPGNGRTRDAMANAAASIVAPVTVLDQLEMSRSLSKEEYRERLATLQARLHVAHIEARRRGISSLLLFEGPDAAGKGGAIRRLNAALDARNYQVHGIAAPSDEEAARHYLWRFWRRLPRAGRIAIFDRSWYGRVLVERVEGFAAEHEWRRAYAEINDFEGQLIEHGIVLMKFWIHITPEEQYKRFKERRQTPYKRWKLTDEDWRNREKWPEYAVAVNDMIQQTSSSSAPWTLVEGNDKRHARIRVLESFVERLEAAVGTVGPEAPTDVAV